MAVRVVAVAAILILVVLGIAARKPERFRVQRAIRIGTAPENVFALIDDFHEWPKWAPQDREDASMTRTHSGAARGVGRFRIGSARGVLGEGG